MGERWQSREKRRPDSFWTRQTREGWWRDLPSVRNGPTVRRLYSQSVAAAHREVHTRCHGDDPRAREKLANLLFFRYSTCWSAFPNQTDLFKFDILKICRFSFWFFVFFWRQFHLCWLPVSLLTNNLSLVFHFTKIMFICWELFLSCVCGKTSHFPSFHALC